VNREAQSIVLALLGGALVHAGLTDLYLRYVKAELRPLLVAAGVLLVLVAVVTAWYEWRSARTQARPHGHREAGVAWLLLPALLALGLVVPPALGSYSAMNTGTALRPPLGSLAPLPVDGPLHLGVIDYAGRAVYDHGRALADRPITLTGFLTIGRDGQPYLTRMILNCCAADAQPVKVGLTGKLPPVLEPDTWFAATGTYTTRRTTDAINSGPIPFFDVSQADPIPVPAEPYESW
jgi:uncharacterized repeat protein (TIGR03943 family)